VRNLVILGLLKIISWLPSRIARSKGRICGWFLYSFNARPTQITRINLSLCYPNRCPLELESLCKKRMLDLGKAIFETPKVWRKGNPWITDKVVAIEGLDLFQDALQKDSGTILIIPHLGNWEVLGLWAGQFKPMTSLYDPPKMVVLENWIKTSRQQSGATLVPTNVRGVSALIKALKRGEISGILPDQKPPPASGDFASFMGVETRTMTLIHKLLQRSGAQALMCTALRAPSGWTLHFLPVDKDVYNADQAVSLKAMNNSVAAMVDLAPEQYQWEYKRFRERPNAMGSVYD
jgi:KDO2-lipid IV(A) lauroyltransferase